MKAIIYERYGTPEVMKYTEVKKPVAKDDELLVKIKASSLNMADSILLNGKPFVVRMMGNGIVKPKHRILGADFAGIIEAVGKDVIGYKVGEEVFGESVAYGFGSFSEYVCVPANAIAKKPDNISFEEAASLPVSAVTALKTVYEKATIKKGDRVLVNGASGCVGNYVVQMLKLEGAIVTGTCSKEKMAMVKELGADSVIDYRAEDFTKNGEKYDYIMDTAIYRPIGEYENSLTTEGLHVVIGGNLPRLFKTMFARAFMKKVKKDKLIILNFKPNHEDFERLATMTRNGSIRSVVGRTFPLKDTREAMEFFESKKACGKVVITM